MTQYNSFSEFDEDVKLAARLDFERNFLKTGNYALAHKVCNGIGAEWFPEALREAITALNIDLKAVANNHDLGYYYGDGTQSDFASLNAAFRANGCKVAADRYGWWNWRRWYVRHQAVAFAKLCDDFGWAAYSAAIKERKAAHELK